MKTLHSKIEIGRLRRAVDALDVLGRAAFSAERKLAALASAQGAWRDGQRDLPSSYWDVIGEDAGDLAKTLPEVLARIAEAASHASCAVDHAAGLIAAFEIHQSANASAIKVLDALGRAAQLEEAEAQADEHENSRAEAAQRRFENEHVAKKGGEK